MIKKRNKTIFWKLVFFSLLAGLLTFIPFRGQIRWHKTLWHDSVAVAQQQTQNIQNLVFDANKQNYAFVTDNNQIQKYNIADGKLKASVATNKWKENPTLNNKNSFTIKALAFLNGFSTSQLLVILQADDLVYFAVLDWNNFSIMYVNSLAVSSNLQNASWLLQINSFLTPDVTIWQIQKESDKVVLNQYLLTNFNNMQMISAKQIIEINATFLPSQAQLAAFSTSEAYAYFTFKKNDNSNNGVYVLRLHKQQENMISANSMLHFFLSDPIKRLHQVRINNQTHLFFSSSSSFYFYTYTDADFGSSLVQPKKIDFENKNSSDDYDIKDLIPLFSNDNDSAGFVALLNNNSFVHFSSDFQRVNYRFVSLMPNQKPARLLATRNFSWYVQLDNNDLLLFNNAILVGKVGNSVARQSESVASVSFKHQNALADNIVFQKVSDDGINPSVAFQTFVNNNAANFLNINSYDEAFGMPVFEAQVSKITKLDNQTNYGVTIVFYQQLKQANSQTTNKVIIGVNRYLFFNANLKITIKPKEQVPIYLLNKLPSEIQTSDLSVFLTLENVGEHSFVLVPNDAQGILTIRLFTNVVYVADKLELNYNQDIIIGTTAQPYFLKDQFNGLSSQIHLVTQDYLDQNNLLQNTLMIKYSNVLASSVTAQNIIDDFIVYGAAFNNANVVQNNLLVKPKPSDITLIPVDDKGYIYVRVNFPKTAYKTNQIYTFNTAAVFKKDFISNKNAFLVFKQNSDVLKIQSVTENNAQAATTFASFLPSTLANLIQNDKLYITNFVYISHFLLNIIINQQNSDLFTLTVIPNDALGTLTISFVFKKELVSLNQNTFSYTFSGFTQNRNITAAPTNENNFPSFNWGELDVNVFNQLTPREISAETLMVNYRQLFVQNVAASQLQRKIEVTPLNKSGGVLVTIRFFNWWEFQIINGVRQPVLLNEKTFTTIIRNGLRSVDEAINSVIWKSFDELELSYRNTKLASQFVDTVITNFPDNKLAQLEIVANLSDVLKKYLTTNPDNLSLSFVADDNLGKVDVFANLNINGLLQTTQTTLSGFDLKTDNYLINWLANDDASVMQSKKLLPSQVSDADIWKWINISVGNDLSKKLERDYDDHLGTLTIKLQLYKNNEPNRILASSSQTYVGFQKIQPKYQTTDFKIIAIAIALPLGILIIPILHIFLIRNRFDIRRFAKRLNKRVEDVDNKKVVKVKEVKDLVSFFED